MPLDPRARALLDGMEALGEPPLEELSVPEARQRMANFKEIQAEPPPIATVEDRTLPGAAGALPVRIYTPQVALPAPLLVYFHGGGWTIGDLDVTDVPSRALAHATGGVVVSVDYRLAPEHRFPAALDDCYAATRWAAEHAAELGGDAKRLVVIGDSAGGNLAAAVALQAREQGGPPIAYQVLIYPVIDYSFDRPSYRDNADGYLLTTAAMRWFWGHYLGDEADGADWRASPLRAADLSGLPPALIATCEFDPLRDEGEAYADSLRAAGVAVKLHRYAGMIHGFYWMSKVLPQAQELLDEIAAELQSALRPLAPA